MTVAILLPGSCPQQVPAGSVLPAVGRALRPPIHSFPGGGSTRAAANQSGGAGRPGHAGSGSPRLTADPGDVPLAPGCILGPRAHTHTHIHTHIHKHAGLRTLSHMAVYTWSPYTQPPTQTPRAHSYTANTTTKTPDTIQMRTHTAH
jgi:hypothetical protein